MLRQPHFSTFVCLLHAASCCFASDPKDASYLPPVPSVEVAKRDIRNALTERCGTGSCWNWNATQVCNIVAAVDIRTDYAVTDAMVSANRKPSIPISEGDIALMKLIFSQCKPTTYQHWLFSSPMHVVYDPSPQAKVEVNKLLGIKSER